MRLRFTKHLKLSQPGVKKHIDAEHELMKKEIKKFIAEKLEESKGILFEQHVHDFKPFYASALGSFCKLLRAKR